MPTTDDADDATALDLIHLIDCGAYPDLHPADTMDEVRFAAARDRLVARGLAVLIDGIGYITAAGTAQALAAREAAFQARAEA